jgi:hypothetical protein
MLLAGQANAQCTKDTDCKGDRVCEAGKCTAPATAATAAPPPGPGEAAPGATAPPDPAHPEAAPGAGAPVVGQALPQAPAAQPPPSSMATEPAAPPPLPPAAPKTHRRSKRALVGGIVMVSAGPIALLGAVAARNAQKRCDDRLSTDYPGNVLPPSERYRVDDCNDYSVPIYFLGITGALLTTIGIPLIIYGAKTVPDTRASRSLEVQPWATPNAGGVRLRLTL